ncbi:MAG: cyclic pyranopterin monophosphate synthase MoaC [Streptosporangiaceae bacterium]
MTKDLSHVGPDGRARMVDVSTKPATVRTARATGCIRMLPATLEAIQTNAVSKGDVLGVARIAGVMAAKRTAELVPLCHPLPLDDVQVALSADPALPGIRAEATTRTSGRTGVEMEAIVAVTLALVTVYDMAKAIDRGMTIGEVLLMEKTGGQGGGWTRG